MTETKQQKRYHTQAGDSMSDEKEIDALEALNEVSHSTSKSGTKKNVVFKKATLTKEQKAYAQKVRTFVKGYKSKITMINNTLSSDEFKQLANAVSSNDDTKDYLHRAISVRAREMVAMINQVESVLNLCE